MSVFRHEVCCEIENCYHVCIYCAGTWPCEPERVKREVIAKVLEIVNSPGLEKRAAELIANKIKEL